MYKTNYYSIGLGIILLIFFEVALIITRSITWGTQAVILVWFILLLIEQIDLIKSYKNENYIPTMARIFGIKYIESLIWLNSLFLFNKDEKMIIKKRYRNYISELKSEGLSSNEILKKFGSVDKYLEDYLEEIYTDKVNDFVEVSFSNKEEYTINEIIKELNGYKLFTSSFKKQLKSQLNDYVETEEVSSDEIKEIISELNVYEIKKSISIHLSIKVLKFLLIMLIGGFILGFFIGVLFL